MRVLKFAIEEIEQQRSLDDLSELACAADEALIAAEALCEMHSELMATGDVSFNMKRTMQRHLGSVAVEAFHEPSATRRFQIAN